jgi:nodulation protein E
LCYGLLAGYGASSDAEDLTNPSVDGAARAISAALRSAQLGVDDVDYVNAHGTGTKVNDAAEAKAIRAVFGNAADRLLVSSSKAVLGHSMGAAGGLEAVVTLLALRGEIAPPTAGWQEADPDCRLDVVPNVARPQKLRAALSNSLAFGGLNAVLAFKRI